MDAESNLEMEITWFKIGCLVVRLVLLHVLENRIIS